MKKLVLDLLEGKSSIREILEASSVDIGDEPIEDAPAEEIVSDEAEYRHLFVRRFHGGEEKPYKRAKLGSASEALNLFFEWLYRYRQDRVEIWTDVAADAKNFYRFCLENRDFLEQLWKGSPRMKKQGLFSAAYLGIKKKATQNGMNLVGTLYPFEVN